MHVSPRLLIAALGLSLIPQAINSTSNVEAATLQPLAAQFLLAQNEVSEPADEVNIFEHINIELLDLQKMGDEVSQRLVGEQIRLSLDECVAMALANNHDIQIIKYESSISEADVKAARGEFDPVLTGNFRHIDGTSPPSPTEAAFGGFTTNIESQRTDYQITLGGKLPFWGTRYNVDYVLGREAGTFTRNPITGDSLSTYTGSVTTTITQPLLRGRGTALNRTRIAIAQNGELIAQSEIKRTALFTIGETIKAYWDLVGAIQNLEVRKESLDNAMRLVSINEQRLEIGTAAAIEVLQAKAGAATRYSDLVTARTGILDAEDALKNFINMNDNQVFSSRSIVPTTSPGVVGHDWDLEKSIETALANRPEIQSAQLQIDNAELDARRTKNDLLPTLDGTYTYGRSARELEASDLPQGIRDKQGRTWTIGVTGSFPIGNRAARGAHTRSKQVQRQQELRLAKTERDIMLDVRTGIRGVVTSEILVESNKQARTLQEANVAAEEKRLKLGVTTSQDVLDRQEDLTLAQTQELQSIVNYEKSLIQLQVAEGTLLENLNIDWDTSEEE